MSIEQKVLNAIGNTGRSAPKISLMIVEPLPDVNRALKSLSKTNQITTKGGSSLFWRK